MIIAQVIIIICMLDFEKQINVDSMVGSWNSKETRNFENKETPKKKSKQPCKETSLIFILFTHMKTHFATCERSKADDLKLDMVQYIL